jgi:hypothetical protein
MKDWILWQQEIDLQDDPDMDDRAKLEFPGETNASKPKTPSNLAHDGGAKPK